MLWSRIAQRNSTGCFGGSGPANRRDAFGRRTAIHASEPTALLGGRSACGLVACSLPCVRSRSVQATLRSWSGASLRVCRPCRGLSGTETLTGRPVPGVFAGTISLAFGVEERQAGLSTACLAARNPRQPLWQPALRTTRQVGDRWTLLRTRRHLSLNLNWSVFT